MDVRKALFESADEKYKSFNIKLIPTVAPERIIGVRIPIIRNIARTAVKDGADIEPYYYEEVMVKGLMIGYSKLTVTEYISRLNSFIPLIDNWAVCDSVSSNCKFTKKYQSEIWEFLQPLLSGGEYSVRFALVMMMDYYINDVYVQRVADCYSNIHSDFYYVNMAAAWGLSVIFVKYPSVVLPMLQNGVLDNELHNRTIQKIRDSLRVDAKVKEYLKTLRR